MNNYIMHQADAREWAGYYAGPAFDALFADAPYHLTSITERFGQPNATPAKPGRDGAFTRIGRGFMGQMWDGGDIAFDPAFWRATAERLSAGAPGAVFAAARNGHRLAAALEDGGLQVLQVSAWVRPGGVPKPTRASAMLKRREAATPGQTRHSSEWDGYGYGAGCLKPVAEPIVFFRKPTRSKKPAPAFPATFPYRRANAREAMAGLSGRNPHPTIKPLGLCQQIARLLADASPRGQRLCVPFAGTGSEMIGGLLAGWPQVEGIENHPPYIPLAEARLRFWTMRPHADLYLQHIETLDPEAGDEWRQLHIF